MGCHGSDATLGPIEPEQRRRFQLAAAAFLAVVLLSLGVIVAFRKDAPTDLVDASRSTSSTTFADPIVVATTLPSAPVGTTTSTTLRRPARVTTTTTTVPPPAEFPDSEAKLVCARTTKSEPTPAPDDWAFYWQTKPKPNDGLDLVICVDDETPKVGATIKLHVLAQDPDAEVGNGPCDVHVTWESNSGTQCREGVIAPPADPKPTPPEKPGKVTMTFIHEYAEPGQWVIDVSAWSSPENGDRNPYASYNSIEMRVNVHR